MDDLRLKISNAAKKMWKKMPKKKKLERLSKAGMNGAKKKWQLMTPKQRIALITKMTKARQAKFAALRKAKESKTK